MASWDFYTKEGALKVQQAAGGVGDADTLDGLDSTDFILKAGDTGIGDLSFSASKYPILASDPTLGTHATRQSYTDGRYLKKESGETDTLISTVTVDAATHGGAPLLRNSTGDTPAAGEYVWKEWVDNYLPLGGGSITGNVTFSGASLYMPVATITTTPVTLDDTYRTVLVDSTTLAITVQLPAAPTAGQWYEIKDIGSGGVGNASNNNITVDNNGNAIDGVAGVVTITSDGGSLVVVSDGSNWFSIAGGVGGGGGGTLGGLSDVTLGAATAGSLLRVNAAGTFWEDTTDVTVDGTSGRLSITTDSTSAGLAIGTDTVIYRLAADTLYTPDKVNLGGGVGHNVSTVSSATYTVNLVNEYTILCDTTSNAIVITLPAPTGIGDTVVVKDAVGNVIANNITIDTADTAKIDTLDDYIISTPFQSVTLQTDGTDWFKI